MVIFNQGIYLPFEYMSYCFGEDWLIVEAVEVRVEVSIIVAFKHDYSTTAIEQSLSYLVQGVERE